ncbi:hypothetical protein KC887_02305 [Candidatus Kaiserbacteria bacterium]|nr:hypothetical protein [Candidatus Kaiserbacteria bacterium]
MEKFKKFYKDHQVACETGGLIAVGAAMAFSWYHTGKTVGFDKGYRTAAENLRVVGASKVTREDGRSGVIISLANGYKVALQERKQD